MATNTRPAAKATAARAREALEFARRQAAEAKNWVELHNALFGIGGRLTEMFPTPAERVAFGKTDEHGQIMEQLHGTEEDSPAPPPDASDRFVL
jgi:hypothetical protein